MSAKKNNEQTARVTVILNGQSANAQLRDLEAAARKVKSELSGMQPNSAKFKEAAANYKRINDELMKTRVQAGLARSSWDKMKETITSTFIGTLGSNLAAAGLQKIVGYFVDAYENAKKLSDQFADIRKTTGMTRLEVLALNRELGKMNTRTSMSELREIAKVGGQFGVAKEQILGFVQAVDRTTIALGDEFKGGAEEVATEMAKLRNILQDIKSDDIGTDIGFISNAINELASDGNATGPVISDLANRIGGYGSQIGLTTGQVLGLSATLQELGVTAERGGTAVVKILQKMLTNSNEFARIAGMDLQEFEKLLNDDIYGAFVKVMEGSKSMGQSSTLLAGIIKDLEVQGAGASEVFAKLGSNTEMLQKKVDLAGGSLTNLNSISEEAKLRNDNLAGSAERLSKTWNKFIANPALQGFFQWFIDNITETIKGMGIFADRLAYNYNIISKGKAEADRLFLESQAKLNAESAQEEQRAIATRVQGYKNGLKQLKLSEIQAQKDKIEAIFKGDMEYAKQLTAQGKNKEAAMAIQTAKETALQLKAAKEVLAAKTNINSSTLAGKRELTEKEIKLEQKKATESKKIAEKAANEKKAFEDARAAYEEQEWEKRMYAQIEAMKDLAEMEEQMLKENSAEAINLIREQNLAKAAEYANLVTQTADSIMARQDAIDRAELARDRKKNDEKRRLLKQNLDSGKINQEQYNRQMEALEMQEQAKESAMQKKAAEREKKFRLFLLTLEFLFQMAKAAIALGLDPLQNARAVAAGVQLGVVAATPIPEFYDGGYTPDMGSGIDGKGGFNAILHPNEYVINAKQMANPFVYNFTQQLESSKSGGISSGSSPSGSQNNQVVVQSDPRLIALLEKLDSTGVKGVWDWDYEQRTNERMAELDNRRKL